MGVIGLSLVGVLGALVGGFLGVVIHRLPVGESLISPAWRCPRCRALIAAGDKVPIVSWLLLAGRCRRCGEPIAARYPLVELLTAAAFAAVAAVRGVDADLLVELPFVSALIAVAGIDLEHRIVPNKIVAPAAAWTLAASLLVRPGELAELLVAGACSFGLLLAAAVAYPAGMGMGDVKLAGLMGLGLGLGVAPALVVAFLSASLAGLGLIVRHGLAARKRTVPFAPFLALGGLVGVLAGPGLIELLASAFLP